ncbi:porin family protein [Kordia sp.]|uniref:porin family protein n=1 Tax=Kordia sp. TaxID=1965332 RepID=UPI0025C474B7|nr:porin family protein [Kordia sp.]MCH2194273.1 PorT family protein [Kordia sp.]
MKKLILLSFLLCSCIAFSQEKIKETDDSIDVDDYVSADTETRYGFKIGLNISNYSGTNLNDIQDGFNDSRIGFVAGFFINMSLTERIRFQPEFLYSAQGAKEKNLRADYLQVPLMLKYELTDFLNIQLGPQIGVKIHEFEDNFKNFDFGVNGGIGLTILENVAIEARYNLGLAEMFDEDRVPNFEGKNAVIQIGLTYRL